MSDGPQAGISVCSSVPSQISDRRVIAAQPFAVMNGSKSARDYAIAFDLRRE